MLGISSEGSHNAIYDCQILQKILLKLEIISQMLVQNAKIYSEQMSYWNTQCNFHPIQKYLSISIRKKLSLAGITMQLLTDIYKASGTKGIKEFLQNKIVEKILPIQKSSIAKIVTAIEKCMRYNKSFKRSLMILL